MHDAYVRSAAFEWLRGKVEVHGDVLPWALLLEGFVLRGERVPLLSQQGIFKPRVMQCPLSIRSALGGRYDDKVIGNDQIEYKYRGTSNYGRVQSSSGSDSRASTTRAERRARVRCLSG